MSTRSRTVGVVLSLLLTGPALAGCAGTGSPDATSAATSSSSVPSAEEVPADGVTTTSPAPDAAEESRAGATGFPADTEADTGQASEGAAVTVTDIRMGGHEGFDRVVLEVGGIGTPGWDVRYVDVAASQGSGDVVQVGGNAVLQVTVTGVGYPYATGLEEYAGPALAGSGTSVVEEVVFDSTYEGTAVAFVGTASEAPFRVYALTDPARVVVEVASAG